ncbi:PLP-dependent aminotransferase family protein [Leptolyngbya sp. FACHB-261]|uniref:MocR-like pyridoxine biosynthesis transcription factor PdxR n=1 Tax=Leptolyngbya sp. FACHB-261 TaxID=2692806 RepID=UPI001681FF4E|nr:PLP-dependent aminotransferase family protein [Leptolyngbya sp. FACHB-261]MBD2102757.1 PLP-dependent aminotransferase family protein [Leptolyngbya sp. FACHB-261]
MFWIPLEKSSPTPLTRQVYEYLREQILRGELASGQQLPATRELALNLGVSRNIILLAYEQLLAEGCLEGRPGSGTYVAEGAYLASLAGRLPVANSVASPRNSGVDPVSPALTEKLTDWIDFRSGIPALDQFPRKLWGQLSRQVCVEAPPSQLGYGIAEGCAELRTVLAQYLSRTRGVHCHPDHLVITSGAAQAFALVTKLLLRAGEVAIVEDPVTSELHEIFTTTGATLYPVAVDQQGLRTDLLPENINPKFVFLTPSHQFPLGGILPIQRRIELIQFARTTNCFLLEDDYDSEFRYEGAPLSSLQGLAPEQVLYVGTFSKILSPALRLGYLIVPPSLVEPCRKLKRLADLHTSVLEQLTLARLIESGHLERHIAKMKKLYRQHRNLLVASLFKHFSTDVKILGGSTGLHLVAEFQHVEFSETVLQKIAQHQVRVYPVEVHAIRKGQHCNRIILGYGNLTDIMIETGIQRLQAALMSL